MDLINHQNKVIKLLNEAGADVSLLSDGYHTFDELYRFRTVYNACLFNEWAKQGLYQVHKSWRHNDGESPFGKEDWFIVCAVLPGGLVSNHYQGDDWDLFQIPEYERSLFEYDGHSSGDVLERLLSLCNRAH